jgi:sigma-B regulation protein RsbU (phosphoserine phosphatase)
MELFAGTPPSAVEEDRCDVVGTLRLRLEKLLAKHRRVVARYRRLKRGLDRAGRIQQSLLPTRPPSLEGYRFAHFYRPCEEVGGDFYDFVETRDGLILIVSDVIGHGFEAALTTMLMKEIFEETVATTTEPEELLHRMNGRLHRVLPEGMFAAAAILRMSSPHAEIQFANAGLPYPFVLRAREQVEKVSVAGFPLGLFEVPPAPFDVSAVHLSSGDVLLVGSDGIHAVAGTHGDHFEDDRLPRLLSRLAGRSGEEVIARLMKEALRFGNGAPLPDDLNLLAITRA